MFNKPRFEYLQQRFADVTIGNQDSLFDWTIFGGGRRVIQNAQVGPRWPENKNV